MRVQPGPLLAGGEVDVGLAPSARGHSSSRPRSKPARAQPVLPGQVARVLDAHPPLLGQSTRNSPPNDQNAWPPSVASGSWSSRITRRPASASSAVATSPASPAPTTITSASIWLSNQAAGPRCSREARSSLVRSTWSRAGWAAGPTPSVDRVRQQAQPITLRELGPRPAAAPEAWSFLAAELPLLGTGRRGRGALVVS